MNQRQSTLDSNADFEQEIQFSLDTLEVFGISDDVLSNLRETLNPTETFGDFLVNYIPEHPALTISVATGNYSRENKIASRLRNEKWVEAIKAKDPLVLQLLAS